MKLQRFLNSEQMPSRTATGTVDFQSFTRVGEAVQDLGRATVNAGNIMVEQPGHANRRIKAEEDLEVSKSITRFKSIAQQVVENKRTAYAQDDSVGLGMSKFQPEVVGELTDWLDSEEFDKMSQIARARFKAEGLAHIDTMIPELGKMSSEMIVQGSEKRLGEAEALQLQKAVDAPDAGSLLDTVGQYGLELQKAVHGGTLSEGKSEERLLKFQEKASTQWFERQAAKNPEGMFRAIYSDNPDDKALLAPVDGSKIQSFLKEYGEHRGKDFKEQSAARMRFAFPQAVAGRIMRTDLKDMAPFFTPEDFTKLQSQLDENDKIVLANMEQKRKSEERELKLEQDNIERNFWDSYFSKPTMIGGTVSLEMDGQLKKLEPTRYEHIREKIANARDTGGQGDESSMNYWKMKLFHNSDALSADQILGMNNLNYKQRQELYTAKRTQYEFEQSASKDPKHFSNHPNYKFYEGQIQEQLGIIKLSPFTNASALQILSQAEVAYRDEYRKLYEDGKAHPSQDEAKQLMQNIVKTARENLGFKAKAIGELPMFPDADSLNRAHNEGKLDWKGFTREFEKLKAWRAMQGLDPYGKPLEESKDDKPVREFKKRGKE
jgi:hypothetical protein